MTQRWNTLAYSEIQDAEYRDGKLHVRFGDGTSVAVNASEVVPGGATGSRWQDMHIDGGWLLVPSEAGEVEIPYDVIRIRTDPEYRAHIETLNAKHERDYGRRSSAR